MPSTVSSPEGSAGEGGGFKAAFDAAVADVGMPDEDFHAAAGDPEPELPAEEPAEETTEPEPETKPVVAKPVKVKAHVRNIKEQAKAAAPAVAPVAEPALAAPANWDASRKAVFDKLPPEGRKVLLDMSKGLEAEHGRKSTALSDDVNFARSVAALVTPEHRQQMAAGGIKTIAEGLGELIKLNDYASRDFPGYVSEILTRYGGGAPIADVLRQLFPDAFTGSAEAQPGAQPAPRPATDPLIRQVYDELRATKQRLDGFERRQTDAQRTQELSTADRAIAKFRSEVDDAGNPRRPYLTPEIEEKMVGLLGTPMIASNPDLGERLQLAYDAAIGIVPSVRQQFLDSEKQRWLAEQTKATDVAKARRARAPINSAPSGPAGKPAKGLDGSLRQAMNLHGI